MKYVLVLMALLVTTSLPADVNEFRIDHWSDADRQTRKQADDLVDAAEKNKADVERAIRRAHGIVDANDDNPCSEYDDVVDETEKQFVVKHIVPIRNSEGKCRVGEDEGREIRRQWSVVH